MKLTKICVKKWVEIFSKFAGLIVLNTIRLHVITSINVINNV